MDQYIECMDTLIALFLTMGLDYDNKLALEEVYKTVARPDFKDGDAIKLT